MALLMATEEKEMEKAMRKKEFKKAQHEDALLMAMRIKAEMAMEDSDSDSDTETETEPRRERSQQEKEKYAAEIAKLIKEREKDLKYLRITGKSPIWRRQWSRPPDLIGKDKLKKREDALLMATKEKEMEKAMRKKEFKKAQHEEALLMAMRIKTEMAMEDSDSETETEKETEPEREMSQQETEKHAAEIAKLIEERKKDLKYLSITGKCPIWRREWSQPPNLIGKDKL